jgi:hypothetical protein
MVPMCLPIGQRSYVDLAGEPPPFLSQIFDYGNAAIERRYIFYKRLLPLLEFGREREGIDLSKVTTPDPRSTLSLPTCQPKVTPSAQRLIQLSRSQQHILQAKSQPLAAR